MMGEFAVYSIRTALMLSVLFITYKLTAGRLKCASLRRRILLGIYVAALVIPLATTIGPAVLAHFRPVGDMDSIVVVGAYSIKKSIIAYAGIIDTGKAVMLAGSLAVLASTLVGLLWIFRCRINGRSVRIGELNATIVDKPSISPFSFGRRIFLSESDYSDSNEMIIAHEASHIARRHWIDLIIGRIAVIIQWWNPIAWQMLRELHGVHEFQTDNDVLSAGYDRRDYQYLLLHKTIGSRFQLMTDSFNHTTLKSRIIMINRADSPRRKRLWSLLCIPAMVVGIMAISSQTFASYTFPLSHSLRESQKQRQLGESMAVSTVEKQEKTATGKTNPDIIVDGKMVDPSYMKTLDPKKIKVIHVFKQHENHPNGLVIVDLHK